MMKAQQQVAEFMRDVKGLILPSKPESLEFFEKKKLCLDLIQEEYDELTDDMIMSPGPNLVAIADDLADLLYVVLYTCNAYGIDIEPIFDEVHRSNMTKLGGPKRADGKQLKPDTYQPPQLEPLIKWQMKREPLQSLFNKHITIKNGFMLMAEPAPIDKPRTSKLRIPETSGVLVQFSDHRDYLTVQLEVEEGISRLINYDGLSEVEEWTHS